MKEKSSRSYTGKMLVLLTFGFILGFAGETGLAVEPKLRTLQKVPEAKMTYLYEKGLIGDGSKSIPNENQLSKAERIVNAMIQVETGGVPKRGASGETKSILQWLPATWRQISCSYNLAVNGSKAPLPLNCTNERKVATWKVERFLSKGYTPKEVGMIWNTSLGGQEKPLIRRGTNKHGVKYDSVHHGQKVLAVYNLL